MTYPELRFWPESEFRYSWPETQFIAESLFWGFCWFENRELDVRQKSHSDSTITRTLLNCVYLKNGITELAEICTQVAS